MINLRDVKPRYYVYALKDPRDGGIRYIGKGSGDRMYEHVRQAKLNKADSNNFTKLAGIKQILNAGYDDVDYHIIYETDNEEEAYQRETALIVGLNTLYPYGWNLVEKAKPPLFNKSHTEKSKEKISKANSGKNNVLYGKHLTNEVKQKISSTLKGNMPWNKGQTNIYSEETRKKISENTKLAITEETKNKWREKMIGRTPWNKGLKLKKVVNND